MQSCTWVGEGGKSESHGKQTTGVLLYLHTGILSPQAQLKREQAAVSALRDILWLHQGARKDLREVGYSHTACRIQANAEAF